jgi:tRNA-2-methylthio-N6-dimethylallyladenosine synthase
MNFFIKTFGCQMNKADSESISAILSSSGHLETIDKDQADIFIINTCNVRDHAVKRLQGHVNSLKPRAKAGLKPWIAVGGCVGEMEKSLILTALPQVDIIFGTSSFHELPEAMEAIEAGKRRVDLTILNNVLPDSLPSTPSDPVREWLPISRGCNNFCTYCVVPYARGRERSLPSEDIISRARNLADKGVKEITLLGQNVNSYGNDRGETDAFPVLLRKLNDIEGLKRLRFLTSHPKDMSDATIQAIATCDKICEYIHLPLQAGSDRILDLMNRSYTIEKYRELVDRIRQSIPGVSLSTDLIVGFPGETEAEFDETLRAVREIGFDAAYTFIYSAREGTAAAEMPDETSFAEKERWLRRLIALQSEISLEINRKLIGQKLEVFVERPSRHGGQRQAGRTRSNKVVNCLSDRQLTNQFATVLIEEVTAASLKGTVCGVTE